ncbi:hypothetical protein [uncultured Thiodictyon sp.]|uniref:hypothetical protein n=1 Tax=uncultured Thiodictyon sp. TaxID=1846217 RepID=UPI0025E1F560|nr:hypothetical protein [uncultured Thiodictyon sp.]
MDLFEIARANTAPLEQRTAALQASCPTDGPLATAMAAFVDHIRAQGRIPINMRPWVLSRFLSRGHYQNIYDWATEMADLSGRPRDALLAEKLGTYLTARRTFDGAFADGLCFRYGALNIGGVGPTRYGQPRCRPRWWMRCAYPPYVAADRAPSHRHMNRLRLRDAEG